MASKGKCTSKIISQCKKQGKVCNTTSGKCIEPKTARRGDYPGTLVESEGVYYADILRKKRAPKGKQMPSTKAKEKKKVRFAPEVSTLEDYSPEDLLEAVQQVVNKGMYLSLDTIELYTTKEGLYDVYPGGTDLIMHEIGNIYAKNPDLLDRLNQHVFGVESDEDFIEAYNTYIKELSKGKIKEKEEIEEEIEEEEEEEEEIEEEMAMKLQRELEEGEQLREEVGLQEIEEEEDELLDKYSPKERDFLSALLELYKDKEGKVVYILDTEKLMPIEDAKEMGYSMYEGIDVPIMGSSDILEAYLDNNEDDLTRVDEMIQDYKKLFKPLPSVPPEYKPLPSVPHEYKPLPSVPPEYKPLPKERKKLPGPSATDRYNDTQLIYLINAIRNALSRKGYFNPLLSSKDYKVILNATIKTMLEKGAIYVYEPYRIFVPINEKTNLINRLVSRGLYFDVTHPNMFENWEQVVVNYPILYIDVDNPSFPLITTKDLENRFDNGEIIYIEPKYKLISNDPDFLDKVASTMGYSAEEYPTDEPGFDCYDYDDAYKCSKNTLCNVTTGGCDVYIPDKYFDKKGDLKHLPDDKEDVRYSIVSAKNMDVPVAAVGLEGEEKMKIIQEKIPRLTTVPPEAVTVERRKCYDVKDPLKCKPNEYCLPSGECVPKSKVKPIKGEKLRSMYIKDHSTGKAHGYKFVGTDKEIQDIAAYREQQVAEIYGEPSGEPIEEEEQLVPRRRRKIEEEIEEEIEETPIVAETKKKLKEKVRETKADILSRSGEEIGKMLEREYRTTEVEEGEVEVPLQRVKVETVPELFHGIQKCIGVVSK